MSAASKSIAPRASTPMAANDTELSRASSDDLKARLGSLLARTAEDLREMSAIVAELERRGEDLAGLRLGIVDHLRRIAAGQLLPEIVVQYAGYPQLLRVATGLPLPDQRRLLDEAAVALAVWREGRIEFRRADPLCLTPAQLRQVFIGERLRTDAEQVSYLESRALPKPDSKAGQRSRVRADRQRGGVRIGRSFAPLGDVLEAIAQLRGYARVAGDEDTGMTQAAVRLSQDELRAIKVAAAQSDCSMTDLIRRALWATGLVETRHTEGDA